MSLFGGKNKFNHYTIVIGCGQLGASLANTLSDVGVSVLIIDKNPKEFSKLSTSFGGITLVGDGTELSLLDDADIKQANAVVVVTNNDNINILIAQIAKEHFHVPHVIARLYDPERGCVYQEFGIDTICPAELSAKEINRIVNIQLKVEDEV
ncbi:TrkA family potassium uptake protein [Lachnospiraceae bacterium OttesenSCG-928-D06]|nr:TrkA family potassium uptake protein [Lachnospiraceae bacterium OttesenSCG-928-D06]